MDIICKLTGIDCPNCAAKLERKLQKIDGVDSAIVNFFAEKLFLECDEQNEAAVMEAVEKAVVKFERDAKLTRL